MVDRMRYLRSHANEDEADREQILQETRSLISQLLRGFAVSRFAAAASAGWRVLAGTARFETTGVCVVRAIVIISLVNVSA